MKRLLYFYFKIKINILISGVTYFYSFSFLESDHVIWIFFFLCLFFSLLIEIQEILIYPFYPQSNLLQIKYNSYSNKIQNFQIQYTLYHYTIFLVDMKESVLKVPQIFYGTAWKKEKTSLLVEKALKLGFRGIDTACQPKHYNEPGVGEGILKSGIKRSQLFIQTKFTPVDGQDPNNIPYDPKSGLVSQVRKSLQVSLKNLKTQYIDSLVIHSPLKTLEKTLQVWKVFQQFVKDGKVHYLGISNCYDPKFFKALYQQVEIKPRFLQNRFYSQSGYDKELRKFCDINGIQYQSFWTLTANPHILQSKQLLKMSKKYSRTPAELLYRALTMANIIPLIGTQSEIHMKEDLSIFQFEIQKQDLKTIYSFFDR